MTEYYVAIVGYASIMWCAWFIYKDVFPHLPMDDD